MFVKTEKTYDDDEPHHRIGDGKYGEVPKRLKGADSKSARRRKVCVGSNPTLAARLL